MSAPAAQAEAMASVNDAVLGKLRAPRGARWWGAFGVGLALTLAMVVGITDLFVAGIGSWGVNSTVVWGYAIASYVWWIAIGSGGTLISSILVLTRQDWRHAVNRLAEAMTLFAVAIAGLYPILHLGRPQYFYWLAPYPNTMDLWPQWRSALVWDFWAILSYLLFSILFLYVGLLPDLAALRDRTRGRGWQVIYGVLAMGWRGSALQWRAHGQLHRLLAAIAVPLVVSVHSIVGLDFAASLMPGWQESIFPPYFVFGALYSGFACVLLLALVVRRALNVEDLITPGHLSAMAKIILASCLLMTLSYATEWFTAWYSGEAADRGVIRFLFSGSYAPLYWAQLTLNCLLPQALWFPAVRRTPLALGVVAGGVLVGMWLERILIIWGTLSHDTMPTVWRVFHPTVWDWVLLIGPFGFFGCLYLVFLRVAPALSAYEMRAQAAKAAPPPAIGDPGKAIQARNRPERSRRSDGPAQEREAGRSHGGRLLAEFDSEARVLRAAARVAQDGDTPVDVFAPYPAPAIATVGAGKRLLIGPAMLGVGVAAAALGYGVEWWSAVVDYPLNLGGRPLNSWPAFLVAPVEVGLFAAAFAGLATMFRACGLPRLHHPVFAVPAFERATQDRFFLLAESGASLPRLRRTLEELGALSVEEAHP